MILYCVPTKQTVFVSPSVDVPYSVFITGLNRGSYISAHALLNLLNELGKKTRCEALTNEFNKCNNTGA